MSRFESSRFVRNNKIMNVQVLKSACESLGWSYNLHGNIMTVTDVGQDVSLYGEYALRLNIETNEVVYNNIKL